MGYASKVVDFLDDADHDAHLVSGIYFDDDEDSLASFGEYTEIDLNCEKLVRNLQSLNNQQSVYWAVFRYSHSCKINKRHLRD